MLLPQGVFRSTAQIWLRNNPCIHSNTFHSQQKINLRQPPSSVPSLHDSFPVCNTHIALGLRLKITAVYKDKGNVFLENDMKACGEVEV